VKKRSTELEVTAPNHKKLVDWVDCFRHPT
jgi:hypothetical protein